MFDNKLLVVSIIIVLLFGAGIWFFTGTGTQEELQAEENIVKEIDEKTGTTPQVKIIEFSDPECFYCRKFHSETFGKLKEKYIDSGKVVFEYKHFPLSSIHPDAQKASESIECATEQEKREEMIDKVFSENSLSTYSLKQYAVELGLDSAQFDECLDSGQYYEKVQNNMQEGISLGVQATPTFFINGIEVKGAQPYDVFEQIIEDQLNN